MKKIIYIITALILACNIASGQDTVMDEKDRIAIQVIRPVGLEPGNTSDILLNRMTQAVTLNGMSATFSRFVLIPKISVLDYNVTSTAPIKHSVEVEAFFFIADQISGTILHQASMTVKGVGNNKDQALRNAINTIQARNTKFKTMIQGAKDKVLAFYDAEGEQIIKRIEANIASGDYETALLDINSIPSASTNLYNKASELLATMDQSRKINAEQSVNNNINKVREGSWYDQIVGGK